MQNLYKEHMGSFQDSFNNEQKGAIISSLIMINKADKLPHPKKLVIIEQTAEVLDIKLDDNIFMELLRRGMPHIINVLKTLDAGQKEWYILAVHGVLSAEGNPSDIESSRALNICNEMGVSEDMYVDTIEKTRILRKKFFE